MGSLTGHGGALLAGHAGRHLRESGCTARSDNAAVYDGQRQDRVADSGY